MEIQTTEKSFHMQYLFIQVTSAKYKTCISHQVIYDTILPIYRIKERQDHFYKHSLRYKTLGHIKSNSFTFKLPTVLRYRVTGIRNIISVECDL